MIVVAGPRQIGKTTLVRQVLSGHPSTFAAADEPFPEVVDPFDDQASTALTQARPGSSPTAEWLVRHWSQARTKAKRQAEGECYFLALDEIQKIPRWSEVVKGLWDTDRADNLPLHIVLLGSLPWLIEDHRLHGPRPPRRRRRSDPVDTHPSGRTGRSAARRPSRTWRKTGGKLRLTIGGRYGDTSGKVVEFTILKSAVNILRQAGGRKMSDRITVDPLLCHGKPCIRGLRYPVENVLEWLASGMTTEEILADYADLEREDILAALSFAARLAHVKRHERLAA